jgi:ankyrin repeat protein
VSTTPLPGRPHLEHLRNEARDLQRAVARGDGVALALVATHHPRGALASAGFRLADAQLVVARRYGFASWSRLRRYVASVTELTRAPDEVAPTGDPAADFLLLACLNYSGDDGPARWAEAEALLAEHPDLASENIYVAAALADVGNVQRHLAHDDGAAGREGGPHRWEPLLYLAYARSTRDPGAHAVTATARLLLEAGGDPDAGFLHHGLPSPFTALTGAFGEGEQGPRHQPRHPHSLALARVLLDAGADPNDSQTLYNRMFGADDDHLVLLFEYGLGTGEGGPWRKRLGDAQHPPIDAIPSPERLLRDQLGWAVRHDMAARVRLLVEHGVDIVTPFDDGRSPVETAALAGAVSIVDDLVRAGAPQPALKPADALLAAALADRAHDVARLIEHDPDLPAATVAAYPTAILEAVAAGRGTAAAGLVALGFDVNAPAGPRQSYARGATALHAAAIGNDAELVRELLALGADPDVHDDAFDSTPLGWARYGDAREAVEILSAVTADADSG